MSESYGGFAAPAPLGVGCSYPPSLPGLVGAVRDLVDFVEISPDTLCREEDSDGRAVMRFVPELLDTALAATADVAVVVHGLELSIGTAAGWNEAYLDVLDAFAGHRAFPWHSEHLGFLYALAGHGGALHAGVPLPLPFTQEAVDCVAPRADAMVQRHRVPFLLENAAHYLRDLPADPGWDEVIFLNRLVEGSSCGLLLDLFNLYCNSRNHGFDHLEALQRLRVDRVVEVHVAGGNEERGFLLDSHRDIVPEPVWDMLEWLLPRAPNLCGVVFEVQALALSQVGVERVRTQLARLGSAWHGRGVPS